MVRSFRVHLSLNCCFPGGSESKESACSVGDPGSIPGPGRSPGEGNANPLQHSRLENPMDGGAWQATVPGVAKSQTRPSDFTFSVCWSAALQSTVSPLHTNEISSESMFGRPTELGRYPANTIGCVVLG